MLFYKTTEHIFNGEAGSQWLLLTLEFNDKTI